MRDTFLIIRDARKPRRMALTKNNLNNFKIRVLSIIKKAKCVRRYNKKLVRSELKAAKGRMSFIKAITRDPSSTDSSDRFKAQIQKILIRSAANGRFLRGIVSSDMQIETKILRLNYLPALF